MGAKETILSLKGVSKSFGKQKVLSDISLEIKKGEIFGIVGSSGSGKSTLLKILTGNILPSSGLVQFEPKDLAGYSLLDPSEHLQSIHKNVIALKRTIGYSAQVPSFYDKLTCIENINFFGSLYNLPREILDINGKILLKLVGLDEWRHKFAGELSGGMRKRLDLACALVHDPKILVFDEPTSDLDFILREQMWGLIKKIQQKGTTIVMSSHFIDEIEGLCDRIIILNNNKIEFVGSPEELKLRKDSGIALKVKTSEGDYSKIESLVRKKYSRHSPVFDLHESSGFLKVTLKNISKTEEEVARILTLIKQSKQTVLEFSYAKEGISEMFKELKSKPLYQLPVDTCAKGKRRWFLFGRKKDKKSTELNSGVQNVSKSNLVTFEDKSSSSSQEKKVIKKSQLKKQKKKGAMRK